MPQKKHPAYIPNPAFRTTKKFHAVTEKQAKTASHNVMQPYTYPNSEAYPEPYTVPDDSMHHIYTDPAEREFHRLWLAYTQSEVDNLHAFMRATPEKNLYPIELEALGFTFSCADPHNVIDMLDGKTTKTANTAMTGLKSVNDEPLLPCPECKGKAGVFEVFESKKCAAWIECLKCKKVTSKWITRKTDHEAVTAAITAWNRLPSRKKKAPKA